MITKKLLCELQNDRDNSQLIVREYALFCLGRFVAQTVGEHTFYSTNNMVYGRAMESAKSNALMRCCKDLGVASELWDPQVNSVWFICIKGTSNSWGTSNFLFCFKKKLLQKLSCAKCRCF